MVLLFLYFAHESLWITPYKPTDFAGVISKVTKLFLCWFAQCCFQSESKDKTLKNQGFKVRKDHQSTNKWTFSSCAHLILNWTTDCFSQSRTYNVLFALFSGTALVSNSSFYKVVQWWCGIVGIITLCSKVFFFFLFCFLNLPVYINLLEKWPMNNTIDELCKWTHSDVKSKTPFFSVQLKSSVTVVCVDC